jgi:hypothetical protein
MSAVGSAVAGANAPTALTRCNPTGPLVRIQQLPEASGVAVSRRSPDRLWAHNDSGEPLLLALDSRGAVTGRLRVSGATVEDWEAIAVGPCPSGSCIHIADIGDNDAERRTITIYRVPEPSEATGSVAVADVFRLAYPDGPHDAEALLVTPKGDVLIVTKGDTGPVAVFRVPETAKPGATARLLHVATATQSGKPSERERITDGAVSPSGDWAALRTTGAIAFHRVDELLSGKWQETSRVSLRALGEPQGEGIAFADETTLYVVGEGGGKKQPGTFARLTCTR